MCLKCRLQNDSNFVPASMRQHFINRICFKQGKYHSTFDTTSCQWHATVYGSDIPTKKPDRDRVYIKNTFAVIGISIIVARPCCFDVGRSGTRRFLYLWQVSVMITITQNVYASLLSSICDMSWPATMFTPRSHASVPYSGRLPDALRNDLNIRVLIPRDF